jgi:hypothetical protein
MILRLVCSVVVVRKTLECILEQHVVWCAYVMMCDMHSYALFNSFAAQQHAKGYPDCTICFILRWDSNARIAGISLEAMLGWLG